MPTILETRYMESMPRLLRDLLNELTELKREVKDLRDELQKMNTGEQ